MSNSQNVEIIVFKIIMLGDSYVGKIPFLNQFCDNRYDEDSLKQACVVKRLKFIKRGDKKIELYIIDAAGQERFRSITKMCYKGADGILLMYDISNIKSFELIDGWVNCIKENGDISKIAFIAVGNNCHVKDEERQVNENMKKEFEEKYKIKIIEA